jgi:hypothetical protein
MPCNDITEVIQIVLDESDRLVNYALSKRTCGQAVGVENLLLPLLKGRSVDELLACTPEGLFAKHPPRESIEEFLGLKHLFALQSALEVLTGKAPGRKDDPCPVAAVSYEEGRTIIDAQIVIDAITDKIKSCGGCKGCGTRTKKSIV